MEHTEKGKPKNLNSYSQANLATFASALLGRAQLAANLGQQYGGDRDVYEALGYPTNITYDELAAKYARQDIAKAVINRPVQYSWKGPITLKMIGQPESDIEKAWKEMDKKLKLRSKFVRLDKLASLGRYGVLLMGFDDVSDVTGFAKPVKKTGNRKLEYVKPLGEGHAQISETENNPKDPRFGMPKIYNITFSENDATSEVIIRVHWTRILHVTTELLESEVYGVPVLQSVWNRLLDLEKLVGGSAEMFWRGARPGYQGKVKDDYTLPTDVEDGLQDQLDEFEHNLRRVFINEGVDLEALAQQVSDPANHVDVQIQMISAVTGIPKRILVGSERGELSSAQDLVSWFSYIQTRREEHAEVNILRPFIELCMLYGALPKAKDYIVEWSDLFAASEKDKAEVGHIRAMAVREYTQNPLAEAIIPPKVFYKLFLGLTLDEIKEVEEMTDEEIMEEMKKLAQGTATKQVAAEPVQTNGD